MILGSPGVFILMLLAALISRVVGVPFAYVSTVLILYVTPPF